MYNPPPWLSQPCYEIVPGAIQKSGLGGPSNYLAQGLCSGDGNSPNPQRIIQIGCSTQAYAFGYFPQKEGKSMNSRPGILNRVEYIYIYIYIYTCVYRPCVCVYIFLNAWIGRSHSQHTVNSHKLEAHISKRGSQIPESWLILTSECHWQVLKSPRVWAHFSRFTCWQVTVQTPNVKSTVSKHIAAHEPMAMSSHALLAPSRTCQTLSLACLL